MTITNANYNIGLVTPGRHAHVVTPSDTDRLPFTALTVYVGTGGTIVYETVGGDEVTQVVPDYYELPLQIVKVKATGTTASNIVAYG